MIRYPESRTTERQKDRKRDLFYALATFKHRTFHGRSFLQMSWAICGLAYITKHIWGFRGRRWSAQSYYLVLCFDMCLT